MEKLYLKVPSKEDLKYRNTWLTDPKTMSYNAGLDLDIKGYDKNTGTITKSNEEMLSWYNKWINQEPDRYYAYIYVKEKPIGEIYYYPDGNTHSIGILIDNKYRNQGYSHDAIIELEKIAFEKNNIDKLSDMIPQDRTNAIKVFKKAGFIYTDEEIIEKVFGKDTIVKELIITKEMYFNNKER